MRLINICLTAALVVVLGSCNRAKVEPPPPSKDRVCEEGTDPNAPPPEFDTGCPAFENATQELCDAHGFLFSEDQKMCVKLEDCVPPFQPDGKICKGSGGGSNPGCHSPTPYRRCTAGNVCYCSSTP